jgi:hypothetical protein
LLDVSLQEQYRFDMWASHGITAFRTCY